MNNLHRILLGAAAGLYLTLGSAHAATNSVPAEDYRIHAQDILTIYVVGEKDLPVEYAVSSRGTVMFPYLDSVEVKNKTCDAIANQLKEALAKDYFVDPQVSVGVKSYHKQYVRVLGCVYKPGQIELPGEQRFDVVDVLAAAGGLTDKANKSKIKVTRKGKTDVFSLDKLKEITDPEQKVWLEGDDIVEVKESAL